MQPNKHIDQVTLLLPHKNPEESLALPADKRAAVADEIADVLIYLTELADVLDIDPIAAAREKIVKNAAKYPAPSR